MKASTFEMQMRLSATIYTISDHNQRGTTEVLMEDKISSEEDAKALVEVFFKQYNAALEASISPR